MTHVLDALFAPDTCTSCGTKLKKKNECDDLGELCDYCSKCCPGHCNECDGGDASDRHEDGSIHVCDRCSEPTHCDYGYCVDGGYRCEECNDVYCGECSRNKSDNSYRTKTRCKGLKNMCKECKNKLKKGKKRKKSEKDEAL